MAIYKGDQKMGMIYCPANMAVGTLFPGETFKMACENTDYRTFSQGETSMSAVASQRNSGCASIFCTDAIDISDWSNLEVTFQITKNEGTGSDYDYVSFGFSDAISDSLPSSGANHFPDYVSTGRYTELGVQTRTLSLLEKTGSKYFEFYCGTCDVTITSIKLSRVI